MEQERSGRKFIPPGPFMPRTVKSAAIFLLKPSSNIFLNNLCNRFSRNGANDALLFLPAFKDDQCWYSPNAILLRDVHIFVDVHFVNACFSFILLGNGLDRRSDHPARAAPFGPKIYQYSLVRPQNVLFKFCVRYCLCKSSHFILLINKKIIAKSRKNPRRFSL